MSHHHDDGCCSGHFPVDPNAGDLGVQYSLFSKIDLDKLECLNEDVEGTGKLVFKPWDQRLDKEKFVESADDPELIFNIQFTGNVKLKGLIIIGGEDYSHPSRVRIFKNRQHMSFDDVVCEADQEFELCRDTDGTLEYSIKIVKFSSVYSLTLHFPKNFGADKTKIYYIGMRGEFTATQRDAILLATYEAAPNPCDHKTDIINTVPTQIR